MYTLKKLLAQPPWHYVAALVLTAIVGFFRYYTLPEGIHPGFAWYETLSVAGCFTFLIGALLTVAYFGAFDLFSYVFSPGRTGDGQKYKNYADYTEKKTEKRAKNGYYFVPYYVVGVVVVLISYLFV